MTSVVKPFLFFYFVVEWILDKKYYICKVFETEIKRLTCQLVNSSTIKRYTCLLVYSLTCQLQKDVLQESPNTTLQRQRLLLQMEYYAEKRKP